MSETVRVSFDVSIEDHTIVKAACVEAHINFRDLMKDVFHKTAEDVKKEKISRHVKKRLSRSKRRQNHTFNSRGLG